MNFKFIPIMTTILIIISINLIIIFKITSELNESFIINTTSGRVKGLTIQVLNRSVNQFLGIPYAEPPVGSLRFAKPKPISKPIEGIIDATKAKNSCIQPSIATPLFGDSLLNEDCLTLNIWSDMSDENFSTLKPVMFWIYGGALTIGSIYQFIYNGSVLATYDVVLVSVNYRLGHFGFLYGGEDSAPGNVGFYDQLLGLKWVRENIHLFGGDKNQITIFGESAGSWSVSAHILSPLSKGLFKRAIMQSGAHMYNKDISVSSKEDALAKAKNLAHKLNCTNNEEWLDCLRKVEPDYLLSDILNIANDFTIPVDGTEFLPILAQVAFKEDKFNQGIDIIAGVTRDEGTPVANAVMSELLYKTLTKEDFEEFVNRVNERNHNTINNESVVDFYLNNTDLNDSDAIKHKIWDFFGDFALKCPTYLFAKQYAEHSSESNVFFYEFTYTSGGEALEEEWGVFHGSDLLFVFGLPLLEPTYTSKEDFEFTQHIVELWTNFAKNGKPDNNWPKLIDTKSLSSVTQMKEINPKNSTKYLNNLFANTCDGFWKDYY